MDPWETSETEGIKVKLAEGPEETSVEGFTDNFSEQSCPTVQFEKLPDSADYLKLLESKLKKITDTSGKKTEEESKKVRQKLVADLSKVREDTLAHLLTGCDIGTGCAWYETIRLTTIRNAPKLHPQFTIIGHFNFTPNGSIVTIHILHFPTFVMI